MAHVSCRWCGEIIHRPPEKLVDAGQVAPEGWVHARSLRPHCRDAQHRAQPREEQPQR